MKHKHLRYFCFLLLSVVSLGAWIAPAAPVSLESVQNLAGGIASSVQVSSKSGAAVKMAQAVSRAEVKVAAVASTNAPETAFYVIDRGAVGGFVVMSADDRLDPVLVIAPTGKFDTTPGTPLYDILCGDVRQRVATAEKGGVLRSEGWRSLLDETDPLAQSVAYAGLSSIDDVRVEPLVQSQWNQSTVGGKNVYNYYTPNNYVCGCVATAGSQILRYHEHPKGTVTPVTQTCYVNGKAVDKTMYGGTYSWADMPLVPTSLISDAQRMAIGKLCYDVGVSIYMGWSSGGSGTGGYCLKDAFLDVFGYENAMAYQLKSGTMSDSAIKGALLANFDAGCPVELSIDSAYGGHSIVGDGYGYSRSALYVHLNLGWGGSDDAWYNLPNIGTAYGFNVVDGAVYNIFPDGTGDLLTGRVLDASDGSPIAGATVQALDGSTVVGMAKTTETGIYALLLPGGKTYSVVASASGAEPSTKSVYLKASQTTWTSGRYYSPGTGSIGNSWGNDFSLELASEPVAPEAPTSVSASDGTSTAKVRIAWSAPSGATYYKVYRGTTDSSSAASCLASSVTALYYDDTTAEVGKTYYYWVIAGNSYGESDFSASASGWRAYTIPGAPTGVSASDGTSTENVIVTWNSAALATSYSVWRSESSSSAFAVEIADGLTSTSYADTSAVMGTTYYYWVRATNQGGTSGFSASDTGYRAIAAPSAPTGVSAADGLSATEIAVSWNAVDTATSYSVWRSESSQSSSAVSIANGLTVTYYADTTAVAGKTYTYWVKATNVGGTSGFSDSDAGSLAVIVGPASVTASDGTSADKVSVSWSASSGATSYEVWRGTANAYVLATKIASPTVASYDDKNVQPGTLYYYWVRAVTAAGTSAFSASDSGYASMRVPSGVAATVGKTDGVTVSWLAVTGATSYQIGRGEENATEPSTTLGSATSLSYLDASAVPGVTYAYFVRAVSSACTGNWSTSAKGSRMMPTPTNLTASDGTYTDRVLVSWPALSGAVSYELRRSPINDFTYAEPVGEELTETSFSDTTAEYGLTYYYYLRATFTVGTSDWSVSESGWRGFPVPQNVSAADGTSTSNIKITWDEIDGTVKYQVWRYSVECGLNELIGTSVTASYSDSKNIEPGVRYSYRVKAVFTTGKSEFSDADTGFLKAPAPTVVATDGTSTSQISLSWNASDGVVTYLVYRGTSSASKDATQIASTSMLYHNDTTAERGKLYYYWIKTVTAIDTSDFGTSDSGYIGLPGVATVVATDGTSSDAVTVSWSAVSGAKSYDIYRATSDASSAATRVKQGVTALTWDDTTVTPGQKCWYWVRAVDAGVGLWGASDSGYRTLATPSDVTATINQTDGIKISWKGTTAGVSFEIIRSDTADINEAEVVGTVADKGTYTDDTMAPGKVYYYWVRAYSALSKSAWSSAVSGRRAVSAPAKVAATDGTSLDSVTITWTEATCAYRYEIWRSTTTSSDKAEQLGTTNKLVWVDATAEPGVAYSYWVKSVSVLDTSAFSARDGGYVSTEPPTDIVASDGEEGVIHVTWTAAADGLALSYAVWRADSEDASKATQLKDALTTTKYDDKTATPGKFYWYWVRPVSKAGPGVFAGPDSGFATIAPPTGITASKNDATKVLVSWTKVNGATSYDVFRAEENDIDKATNVVYASVTTASFNDTEAVPGVQYWYWVRACAEADISSIAGPADGYRLLTAPAKVTATDGSLTNGVQVAWSASWGAASYEVWRATNTTAYASASFLAGVTNALEFLDTNVTAGISFTYWVKAVSDLHTTAFGTYDKGWCSPLPPETVSASDGTTTDGVIIEWSEVPEATKYEIWCNTNTVSGASTNGAKRLYVTTDAATCVYTDTQAKPSVLYWYWVRPVCAPGTGVFSVPDSGYRAVTAPAGLKATDGTYPDYVRVTWGAVGGAESYEVRVAATNELYASTTNFYTVTGTTFDDTNAVPGIVYQYWVRSVSELCTSGYAGPDDGYRKISKLTDVVASDGTSLDGVEVSWTMPKGVSKFKVWRSTTTTFNTATNLATVESSPYVDTSALHGVKYYYWVNGVAEVEGEMSNYNDGWRSLVTPEDTVATDGDSTTHTRITWTLSPDATKYQVWRGTTSDPADMKSIKELTISTNMWEDTTGTAGVLYYYAVRAGGTGGWSSLGTPDAGYKALVPPTSVTATDGTLAGKVTVTWKGSAGATHYQVWRALSDTAEKTALSGWQTGLTFTDTTCQGSTKYWYYVKAAVDAEGTRPSAFSAGDSGYAKDDGTAAQPVDLGGGITWPVVKNPDGSTTTNAISFASIEGGKLTFSGINGSVGATTTVQVQVKTALDSATTYTTPATLTIVSAGTGEVDLSSVWETKTSLFVIGIDTKSGTPLP